MYLHRNSPYERVLKGEHPEYRGENLFLFLKGRGFERGNPWFPLQQFVLEKCSYICYPSKHRNVSNF